MTEQRITFHEFRTAALGPWFDGRGEPARDRLTFGEPLAAAAYALWAATCEFGDMEAGVVLVESDDAALARQCRDSLVAFFEQPVLAPLLKTKVTPGLYRFRLRSGVVIEVASRLYRRPRGLLLTVGLSPGCVEEATTRELGRAVIHAMRDGDGADAERCLGLEPGWLAARCAEREAALPGRAAQEAAKVLRKPVAVLTDDDLAYRPFEAAKLAGAGVSIEREFVGDEGHWIQAHDVLSDGRVKWAVYAPSGERVGLVVGHGPALAACESLISRGLITRFPKREEYPHDDTRST